MKPVAPIIFPDSTRLFVEPRLLLFLTLCASVVLPAPAFNAVAVALLLWCIFLSPMTPTGLAFRLAGPFFALGVLGLIMSGGNDPVGVWRDAWYVMKLCVCLALGMLLGLRLTNADGLHKVLLLFALFSAFYMALVHVAEDFIPAALLSDRQINLSLAALGALPAMGDKIVAYRESKRWFYIACALIILVAAIASDSRITLISIVLIGLGWAGMFTTWQRTLKAAIGLTIAGAILWQFLPEYTGGELNALNKLRRSFEEMSFTDSYDSRAMIFNWRGFEAYNAQLMFEAANVWKQIFGSGLGAEVDLGVMVKMSEDMEYRFLPTIHNGFYYILIKFGIVGIAIYGFGILSWLRWRRRDFDASNLEDRLLRGLIATVLLSTAVITGLFNKEELNGVALLIAFLVGFQYRRHHSLLDRLKWRGGAVHIPVAAPKLAAT